MKLNLKTVSVSVLMVVMFAAAPVWAGGGNTVNVNNSAQATSSYSDDSINLPGGGVGGGSRGVDVTNILGFGVARTNKCYKSMDVYDWQEEKLARHGMMPTFESFQQVAKDCNRPIVVEPEPLMVAADVYDASGKGSVVTRTAPVVQSTVIQPQPATTTVTIPAGPIKVRASDGAVRYVRSKDAKRALLQGKTVRIGPAKATMADIIN